jgi:hypothetical protein
LSAFLKKQCASLEPTPKKPVGAPHTIVVTASGIRAADLCRSLKTGLPKQGTKNPEVAKLFAKHMKLAEQVAHLKKNKYATSPGSILYANIFAELTLAWVHRTDWLRYWKRRHCLRPT